MMIEFDQARQRPIDRVVNVNMLQAHNNEWEKRRREALKEALHTDFSYKGGIGITIVIEEALRKGLADPNESDPIEDIRKDLGYEPHHVHFIANRDKKPDDPNDVPKDGLTVITNHHVEQVHREFLGPDPVPGKSARCMVLMDAHHRDGVTTIFGAHLGFGPEQDQEAAMLLTRLHEHLSSGVELSADDQESIEKLLKSGKIPQTSVLGLADTNASPETRAHQILTSELQDITTPALRALGFNYTWPVDIDWLRDLKRRNGEPADDFDFEGQQRIMDYVFASGLQPVGVKLLGTKKAKVEIAKGVYVETYGSDHSFTAAYFR